MIRKSFLAAIILAVANISTSSAQNKDYRKLYSQLTDPEKQEKLLKEWEAADKNDAELYVAYARYYMAARERNRMVLKDSVGETIAFMGPSDVWYSQQAKEYLVKGMVIHPERLDIRFGYVHLLTLEGNYVGMTQEVEKALVIDQKSKHQWTWAMDEPVTDDRFLGAIQDFAAMAFEGEDYASVRKVGEEVLAYYPDHVESLSNIGVSYLLDKDYDTALKYFLKAKEFNGKDIVVLNNIAESYKRKDDKGNARKYYEEMVKYGNDEDVQYAKEKIKGLR